MYSIGMLVGGFVVAAIAFALAYQSTSSKKKALIIALIILAASVAFNFIKAGINSMPESTSDTSSESSTIVDTSAKTYTFQDINLMLMGHFNFCTFDDVDEDFYQNFSRKDEEGFVDERLILSEDDPPVALYCHTLKDPSVTIDDMLTYAKEQGGSDVEEITLGVKGDIRGIKVTTKDDSNDDIFYYREVLFIIDGKLYDFYSAWDSIDELNTTMDAITVAISLVNAK